MPLKSDLLRLRDLCRTSLDLTFFGHRCTVWLIHEDLADALFFYRHHIRSDGALANTHVMLHAPGGFYRSLLAKDHAPKTMIGIPANKEDPLFHRVFQDWSGAPSVLPPFFTRTLQDRFTVTPGAVIAPAVGDGQTGWLLRGANYAGKSSLAMALIQRGFGLVSDHLVVRQNTDGTCMGYHSPIGLRRHNYHAFRAREDLDRISHRETISADTGPVALVHAEDLLDVKRLDSCKPGLELTLQRDPKCREITLHRSRPKPRRRAGPGHCAAARPNAPRRHSRHPHQSFRMTLTLSDTTDWTAKRADFARPEFSLAIVDNLLTAESARAICRDLHALPGWHQPDWGKNWFDLSSGYQQLINPDLPGAFPPFANPSSPRWTGRSRCA